MTSRKRVQLGCAHIAIGFASGDEPEAQVPCCADSRQSESLVFEQVGDLAGDAEGEARADLGLRRSAGERDLS